jgi:dephospho-CoA kinase
MIVLGLVGSPAGGKSTVAAYLQGLGATWINADLIAREVLEEDEVQEQVIRHFGSEITNSGGRIDRSKLASRVFGDDDRDRAALTYLEGLIHPRTRLVVSARLRALAHQEAVAAILDVPLLFESQWDLFCDEVWCVDSERSLRLARASKRGWDDDQLRRREANQTDIEEKKRLSNIVIDNNGTLAELHHKIDRHWKALLARQSEHVHDKHCLKGDDTTLPAKEDPSE